jgi:hypothetical protein
VAGHPFLVDHRLARRFPAVKALLPPKLLPQPKRHPRKHRRLKNRPPSLLPAAKALLLPASQIIPILAMILMVIPTLRRAVHRRHEH